MIYQSPNFRLAADDRIATLTMDFRGRPDNSFTLPILNELGLLLDRIQTIPAIDVLILRSGKPGAFSSGFDPDEFARFTTTVEVSAFCTRGQEVTRKLSRLRPLTLAVIDGGCSGAGLELALAGDYRFAVDAARTVLEFPDARLGLVPSWGGTVRLPRLVGVRAGLPILLGETSADAARARRIGLVDRSSPTARAEIDLQTFVDSLQDSGAKPARPSWRRRFLDAFARPDVAIARHRREVANETPVKRAVAEGLFSCVAAGLRAEGEGMAVERRTLVRLAFAEPTRRLLELNRLEKRPIRFFPTPTNPIPALPRRVGIVGGSAQGIVLATRFANLGLEVVLQEQDGERVEHTRRVLARGAMANGPQSIRMTGEWHGFENADVVIEAADEEIGVKRNLFHELERRVRPRVPLATASTTISVAAIQAEMARPSRVLGFHILPLDRGNPLVEIVGGPRTSSDVLAAVSAWGQSWGLIPVRAADRPGRLVTQVALSYLSEGVALVAEGMPPDNLDRACRQFGLGRGPLEWCDAIGFDQLASLITNLQDARGDDFARNLLFERLRSFGWLGRPTGEGFYRYGRHRRPNGLARMVLWRDLDPDARARYIYDPAAFAAEGLERVVLRTVNEAASCLPDEPAADPARVDLALARGMGWAPQRGGPLRYADGLGLTTVVERLDLLAELYGSRFEPCDELRRRAEAGESFHGETSPAEIRENYASQKAA